MNFFFVQTTKCSQRTTKKKNAWKYLARTKFLSVKSDESSKMTVHLSQSIPSENKAKAPPAVCITA